MARPKENEREILQSTTRTKLLSAAADAIARAGYDSANINDISTAAGFAKGTIYNYFPSKRDLMLALLKDIAERHVNFISKATLEVEEPQERLERFFEAGFTFVSQNRAQSQVLIITLFGFDNQLKEIMYESYQPLFQLLALEVVTLGIKTGLFRQVDPLETAGLLMTTYLGSASQIYEKGQLWLAPQNVSDFAFHALKA
jgi:AcrR family transcriptional regulator